MAIQVALSEVDVAEIISVADNTGFGMIEQSQLMLRTKFWSVVQKMERFARVGSRKSTSRSNCSCFIEAKGRDRSLWLLVA